MKRIEPSSIYNYMPCSVVAVGCAIGADSVNALNGLKSRSLHSDGYLSLRGMESLVKANLDVTGKEYYRKGQRPALRDFAHAHEGRKAVICLLGHFVYFDGHDYYSFFKNGGDQVVQVWYVKEKSDD